MTLSYYPLGVFLVFLLHSYNTIAVTLRDYSFIWALLFGIIGAFLAACALTVSKFLRKRIIWIHYYLSAFGSVLMLIAGIVLIENRRGVGE